MSAGLKLRGMNSEEEQRNVSLRNYVPPLNNTDALNESNQFKMK
jgi:hypothetical protein